MQRLILQRSRNIAGRGGERSCNCHDICDFYNGNETISLRNSVFCCFQIINEKKITLHIKIFYVICFVLIF